MEQASECENRIPEVSKQLCDWEQQNDGGGIACQSQDASEAVMNKIEEIIRKFREPSVSLKASQSNLDLEFTITAFAR